MKNKLIYALMALATCFSFVSCGDDDDDASAKETSVLSRMNDNQMYWNDSKSDVKCWLDIRPAKDDDEGAHYVTIRNDEFEFRFDLGTPLVGSKIDLANPVTDVNGHQFSFGNNDFGMDVYDNKVYGYIDSDESDQQSCFSSGYVDIKQDEKGFFLNMEGELRNSRKFALKLFVPTEQINIWN